MQGTNREPRLREFVTWRGGGDGARHAEISDQRVTFESMMFSGLMSRWTMPCRGRSRVHPRLRRYTECITDRQLFFALQSLAQGLARHIGHDVIEEPLRLPRIEERQDVRMAEVPVTRISRMNRSAVRAEAMSGRKTFRAMGRSSFRSWANQTVAIPPRPSTRSSRKRPCTAARNRAASSFIGARLAYGPRDEAARRAPASSAASRPVCLGRFSRIDAMRDTPQLELQCFGAPNARLDGKAAPPQVLCTSTLPCSSTWRSRRTGPSAYPSLQPVVAGQAGRSGAAVPEYGR